MARSTKQKQAEDWLAEKQFPGSKDDWFAEKTQSLEDIMDEKTGATKKGPLNIWIIIMAFSLLVIVISVVVIVGVGKKPSEALPTPIDAQALIAANTTRNNSEARKVLDDNTLIIKKCGSITDKPCDNFQAALASLEETLNQRPSDVALTEQLKKTLKDGYLTYGKQLFNNATTAASFRLGLTQVRNAKRLYPDDKELIELEIKSDTYTQGWGKFEVQRYSEAAGLFKIIWVDQNDHNFYNTGRKYYDSLIMLADELSKPSVNNVKDAAFYLREALVLNIGAAENRAIQDRLSKLPADS